MGASRCRWFVAAVWLAVANPAWADCWDIRLAGDSRDASGWLERTVAGALAQGAEDTSSVGALYEWGTGLPRNYRAAQAWYHRAAALGSLDGLVDEAVLVDGGFGVAADSAGAIAVFRAAAALGSAAAETRLGMAYQWGRGVEQDTQQAQWHYRRADQLGAPLAAMFLALMPVPGTRNNGSLLK